MQTIHELDNAKIETLKSIHRLMVQGATEGERTAADAAFNRYCNRFGLDAEITSDVLQYMNGYKKREDFTFRSKPEPKPEPEQYDWFKFIYKNEMEKRLLKEMLRNYFGGDFSRRKSRERAYNVHMQVTDAVKFRYAYDNAIARLRDRVRSFEESLVNEYCEDTDRWGWQSMNY
jgi:hypothetical protein